MLKIHIDENAFLHLRERGEIPNHPLPTFMTRAKILLFPIKNPGYAAERKCFVKQSNYESSLNSLCFKTVLCSDIYPHN